MTFSDFQHRVGTWVLACFGRQNYKDPKQRADRFMEEAIELYQACGGTHHDVLELANYVYHRPAGDIMQEVGGVSVTLAALCSAQGIALGAAATREITRVEQNIDRIRLKQLGKVNPGSPLPGGADHEGQ